MFSRRPMILLLVCIAFSSAGCDVIGLRQFSASIDEFRRQLDKTTKDGGDLDRLLGELKTDLSDLIKQAEDAGGKLEDKIVLNFIEQKEDVFKRISELQKTAFKQIDEAIVQGQSGVLTIPRELNPIIDRLPSEIIPQFYAAVALLPRIPGVRSPDVYGLTGLEATYRKNGYYKIIFIGKEARHSGLRLNNKETLFPINPTDAMAIFEPQVQTIADFFNDINRNMVGAKFIKDGNPNADIYNAQMVIYPLFPVQYQLKVALPGGREQNLTIEQGSGLEEILNGETQRLRKHGRSDMEIAARHYELYQLARKRLPYGISKVTLPPDSVWELNVVLLNGEASILSRNQPTFNGILTSWEYLPGVGGNRDLRLTISASPHN